MQILGPTPPRLPIGHSDFVKLRRAGLTYVDKTAFVAQVLGDPADVHLYPRPRRFGKTLNISTVRHFLERGALDHSDLFADTEIWTAEGGRYRPHFQRHPVIYLTFKDVKFMTWPETWGTIRELLRDEIRRFRDVNRITDHLTAEEQHDLDEMLAHDASPIVLGSTLRRLAEWGHRASGQLTAILIDEYDAPMLTGWQYGYWAEAVSFFRAFLGAGFKDNPHLFRGVLTGILRVAKEGIFSGLNNVATFSLLAPGAGATCFGFTEPEVEALAVACGQGAKLSEIATWYNGYRFGGNEAHTIYNPWSLFEYLRNPAAGFLPYWKNTSANDLIHALLVRHAAEAGPQFEVLLAGGQVTVEIDESVALQELDDSAIALWSLLLFSGYLTAEAVTADEHGKAVTVRLPNREVAQVYRTTFRRLLGEGGPPREAPVIAKAILAGDAETTGLELERLLLSMLSHHDLGARPVEAVYQAFIVGLLVAIEPTHRVTSNREAGYGRADVLITPKTPGGAGAVLELKVVNPRQTPEAALASAVAQLQDRRYHTEVRAAGAQAVHQYAVVFDGKRCWLEVVPEN